MTDRRSPIEVLVVGASSPCQQTIGAVLDETSRLHFVNTPDHGRQTVQSTAGIHVVLQVPCDTGPTASTTLHSVLHFVQDFPYTPCIGLFVEHQSGLNALARLGTAGVAEIVSSAQLEQRQALPAALDGCRQLTATRQLWDRAALALDDQLATLLKVALRLAHAPITLDRLAVAAHWHERTLRKYCQRHRYPSPQWIIGWARCLLIAHYLDEPGRTVKSIAQLLQFDTPVLLANHVRRYTGRSATTLRDAGAVTTVARCLEAALDTPATPRVPAPRTRHATHRAPPAAIHMTSPA